MMRILRYCWFYFVVKLTGLLPDLAPIMRLRGFLVRPRFKRCGRNFQIASNAMIVFTSNVSIGNDVYIAYGAWIQGGGGVTLEDEVMLGPYVVLVAGDHGLASGSYRFGPGRRAPIVVGRGAWLGAHAVVTKGVTIGAGSLLAANAVATKDIPADCVAGGVPARVIRENESQRTTSKE